ncbi:MAG: hypothetical protein PHR46_00010 [Candidatus Absconditabacteria bacterium]|nr:hypothetical protein [Candidatus Absconditabacteria bacterium]
MTITNNGGSANYTFTENGDFTFTFTDAYGNIGIETAIVTRIDKTPVVGTISYSTTGNTNQDVTANITFNKTGVTITNNGGMANYTFTENGNFTFTCIDAYGNTGSTTATVSWIDKTPVLGTISYSTTGNTNQDVTASITFNKTGVTITNNGGNANYTFTENGNFTFTFIDAYGNTGSTTATVSWIDKTPVLGTINYSTTGNTNEDVTANIAFNKTGVTVTNNGGSASYMFTQNGSFTFHFTDAYGNTGSAIATVNWIDKSAVIGTISYSTTGNTNEDVTASIAFNKTGVTVTNNGGSANYTFTENGSFTFEFEDAYGNTGNTTAIVNWIDKSAVIGTINYSTTGNTNEDVTATLSFNKTGVNITNNGGSASYIFTENGNFTFHFTDTYGNTGSETATVTRIDKSAVIGTISYSTTGNTNENVTATIAFNKTGVSITNNGGLTNYSFTENGSFTFTFTDAYGNTGSATATVNWIDKSAVIGTINYSTTGNTNQDVTANITFNKTGVSITNNGGSANYIFAENGNFTFHFTDEYGNTGSATATVTRIDKTPVLGTISYSTTGNTNQDVTANIAFNKTGVTITNNGGSANYTFTENGNFTFTFTDAYGNTGSAIATVSWIDKTAVIGTISYSTTGNTNQDVTASIAFNKTGVTITNNGGSVSYVFTGNGDFTFTFMDAYGNTGSTTATVTRINAFSSGIGRGNGLIRDHCSNGGYSPSLYDNHCETPPYMEHTSSDEKGGSSPPPEIKPLPRKLLYAWSFEQGLTTMPTLELARFGDTVTRAEVAKIISVYATKFLNRKIDPTKTACLEFSDLGEVDIELQGYIIQACQLGLMGYRADGVKIKDTFSPNDTITRAELGTLFSRLLRRNIYAGTDEYRYYRHLLALKKKLIMNLIDTPLMPELRESLYLILYRQSHRDI